MWRLYLSGVGLLIAANLSPVTTFCDHSVGTRGLFQDMTCDFRRSMSLWTLATVKFYSEELADINVTCKTANGDTRYTRTHRRKRNSPIQILKSDVDPDLLNGAKCSIMGCYDSDADSNSYMIPASSCIVDFNECSDGTHNCPLDAVCVNTPRGSFTCTCNKVGYTFNITTSQCIDVDECEMDDSVCASYGPNALCINTNGSYECTCEQGYRNNDTFCKNVDECAEGIHSCSSKAECTDIDGGYYCNSTEGSISDSHGNGQLGERVTMETIVMVTDDRAVLIGLIAPLAVLSLVLAVAVTVCLTLAITYHIKRKGDHNYNLQNMKA